MSFVRKIVGPDEKLIGVASVHWIYVIKGLAWFVGFALVGLAFDLSGYRVAQTNFFGAREVALVASDFAFWIITAIGLVIGFFYFLMWIVTEVGLTTKRVIYKTGWLFVNVTEVDLEEIKAENIDNGLFGVFLHYGYVWIDARFIDNLRLPAIANPYAFVKALNNARSHLKSDTMKVVLENKPADVAVKDKRKKRKPQPKEEPVHKGEAEETDGIIVFPRDIKQRKENMRQKLKRVFARRTH